MSRREVMDASAVLMLLQREPGAEDVDLRGAVMNSVNFAEVVQKTVARERPANTLLHELTLLGLSITSFSPQEAQLAGELYQQTKTHGLSLADRHWSEVPHGVEVRGIR